MDSNDRNRLNGWLGRLGGPGFKGSADRNQAVAELRADGADKLFPLLIPMLADLDLEGRCSACGAILPAQG